MNIVAEAPGAVKHFAVTVGELLRVRAELESLIRENRERHHELEWEYSRLSDQLQAVILAAENLTRYAKAAEEDK